MGHSLGSQHALCLGHCHTRLSASLDPQSLIDLTWVLETASFFFLSWLVISVYMFDYLGTYSYHVSFNHLLAIRPVNTYLASTYCRPIFQLVSLTILLLS